ncbi:pupal cuticle protein C1B-like [Galleria mellonella]|uniref:Pupal cuticle protein C1B-like n=1 Tax=Galleria mellonella TaxID=7137 RepID=A0A6J1W8J7_GALME|nr:pupal cuticle protein C1B-like [Galleria mellonella]
MYGKLMVFLCVAGIASAGNQAPAGYTTAAPAVSSVSYASQPRVVSTYGPVASYPGSSALSRSYTGPSITTYSSSPVSRPIASVPQYTAAPVAYSPQPYSAVSVIPRSGVPAVSYSTPAAIPYSGAQGYTVAAPYTAQAYSIPAYSAPAYNTAQTYSGVAYPGYSAVTPGYSGYPSPVQYSSAPAVSQVSYSGLDGSYSF